MKRLIAAAALAALAVPAFAVEIGKPFEQTELDRTLPTFNSNRVQFAAVSGSTVSDASIAVEAADAPQATKSPWANDWNFIAPAL
jgi:hypothetical protein